MRAAVNLRASAASTYNALFRHLRLSFPSLSHCGQGRALLRTHHCGELRPEHVSQDVTLCGWVDSYRDHRGVLFIDLRDRYGKTQVVFGPESGDVVQQLARTLRSEFVIKTTGKVALRPEGTVNDKLPTGGVEVRAVELEVLNISGNPPVQPSGFETPGEDLRLRYRYLDLRRPAMQHTMQLRSRLTKIMRDYFDEHGFIDIETPLLGRSTPEGARDYLVPSRVNKGTFYALPQSPQLYKQILMIAGYDRYVQVARCFRDEDLRADRQPEFTQLDLEMAFVEADDVITIIDGLVARVVQELRGEPLALPLPRMTYREAMERYGHDAPDLRFGMELVDATDLAAQSTFRVFREPSESGGRVRGMNVKGVADQFSRKNIDELTAFVQQDFGAKGLAWFKVDEERQLQSPIAKNFEPALLTKIAQRLEAEANDLLLFVADSFDVTCRALAGLRRRLGAELKLYDPQQMHYSWVVDFPMFAHDPEEGGWAAMHHPFTAPLPDDEALLESEPGAVRAQAYDLVINGLEAGGGTIRIHDQELQQQIFNILGIDDQMAQERFGFLLEALSYGAPPHGGIALGLDRWVMLFSGCDNIRDCITFPKTQRATDLMTGAPSAVEAQQLRDLHIRVHAR